MNISKRVKAVVAVSAAACSVGILALNPTGADASQYCPSGYSCFYNNYNYSPQPGYQNSAGHLSDFKAVSFNDITSSIADSTNSMLYNGLYAYQDANCGTALVFVYRGSQASVGSGGGGWNDKVSSFKLTRADGGYVPC